MTLPVHLVPSLGGVGPGDSVRVEGDEAHHAVVVRRLRTGERVVLTDGRGGRAEGVVGATDKRAFAVDVDECRTEPSPQPALVVVQALPKGDRGELAVEVLTEVGVSEVVPWAAERSVAVWRGERAEKSLSRWRATAREAAKQARRSWHPTVAPLTATSELPALLADVDLALVLHEDAAEPLSAVSVPAHGRVVLVVGPEGGLTDAEVSLLREAGALPVRLGCEVLRTSTAGVAACAALLSRTPRWH